MAYYVRFLTCSEKTVPFSEIVKQGKSIRVVSGTDAAWERLEISQPLENPIATVEKGPVSAGSPAETTLAGLRKSVEGSLPLSARKWLGNYLARVKTVYTFRVDTDRITPDGWPVLGRIQNLLRDSLQGIIQADNEGFYNENGDYILWQMYIGAGGAIPAATLDENGDWITYQLRLEDRAIELFKQGMAPRRGLLSRLLGR